MLFLYFFSWEIFAWHGISSPPTNCPEILSFSCSLYHTFAHKYKPQHEDTHNPSSVTTYFHDKMNFFSFFTPGSGAQKPTKNRTKNKKHHQKNFFLSLTLLIATSFISIYLFLLVLPKQNNNLSYPIKFLFTYRMPVCLVLKTQSRWVHSCADWKIVRCRWESYSMMWRKGKHILNMIFITAYDS